MDCDLQDNPKEILNLYKKAQEGWDIVYAERINSKDSILKSLLSKGFYKLFSFLSGVKTKKGISNFGIYKKKVINEFCKLNEIVSSFPSAIKSLGFRSSYIHVNHNERAEGKSSYTIKKLFHVAGNVIISNSNKPLKIAIISGFSMSTISFSIAIYNISAYFLGIIKLPGFTSTIFSIWFVGGIILTNLGVLCLYIGKIFDQVKGRQGYIVSEKINIT